MVDWSIGPTLKTYLVLESIHAAFKCSTHEDIFWMREKTSNNPSPRWQRQWTGDNINASKTSNHNNSWQTPLENCTWATHDLNSGALSYACCPRVSTVERQLKRLNSRASQTREKIEIMPVLMSGNRCDSLQGPVLSRLSLDSGPAHVTITLWPVLCLASRTLEPQKGGFPTTRSWRDSRVKSQTHLKFG